MKEYFVGIVSAFAVMAAYKIIQSKKSKNVKMISKKWYQELIMMMKAQIKTDFVMVRMQYPVIISCLTESI